MREHSCHTLGFSGVTLQCTAVAHKSFPKRWGWNGEWGWEREHRGSCLWPPAPESPSCILLCGFPHYQWVLPAPSLSLSLAFTLENDMKSWSYSTSITGCRLPATISAQWPHWTKTSVNKNLTRASSSYICWATTPAPGAEGMDVLMGKDKKAWSDATQKVWEVQELGFWG